MKIHTNPHTNHSMETNKDASKARPIKPSNFLNRLITTSYSHLKALSRRIIQPNVASHIKLLNIQKLNKDGDRLPDAKTIRQVEAMVRSVSDLSFVLDKIHFHWRIQESLSERRQLKACQSLSPEQSTILKNHEKTIGGICQELNTIYLENYQARANELINNPRFIDDLKQLLVYFLDIAASMAHESRTSIIALLQQLIAVEGLEIQDRDLVINLLKEAAQLFIKTKCDDDKDTTLDDKNTILKTAHPLLTMERKVITALKGSDRTQALALLEAAMAILARREELCCDIANRLLHQVDKIVKQKPTRAPSLLTSRTQS